MRTRSLVAAFVAGLAAQAQITHIPLDRDWSFSREGRKHSWHKAEVPGVVQTDLLRNGLIADPYVNSNVDSLRWVEDADWVYRRTIDADERLLANAHVDLVFQGLDTFAEIYLNDSLLGTANNMFRAWSWPIRDHLRSGPNEVKVIFRSATAEGRKLRDAYGVEIPHDNDPSGVSPFVRKAAYQFGWDFCPRVLTCGIWQPVELRCWNMGRITDLTLQQFDRGPDVDLLVDVATEIDSASTSVLTISVADTSWNEYPGIHGPRSASRVHLRKPKRWHPAGTGGQDLYTLKVKLTCDGEVVDRWSRTTGFRTIALEQAADGEGRSFAFRVNGAPLFMKGANVVPPSMFLPTAGDAAWRMLVAQARQANMNMLRVWGGGVYPPDAFFDACDSAGILVWQDFMFANLPPADDDFLQNAQVEAMEQRARLETHPSLALWCGNNELQVAWAHWGWQQRYAIHGADSTALAGAYHELFTAYLSSSSSQVPYVATSPLSNWGNDAGLRSGDLHYWGVWHADSSFASYGRNVGRFMSEYGFQSWPDSAFLARYIDPSQLHLGSEALRHRQRSYRTDAPIHQAIRDELHRTPTTLGSFVRDSQEAQALAVRTAVEAHLAARPHCMGTLIWQLNDAWPGPSWSLMDMEGGWKPAMREVRDLFGR